MLNFKNTFEVTDKFEIVPCGFTRPSIVRAFFLGILATALLKLLQFLQNLQVVAFVYLVVLVNFHVHAVQKQLGSPAQAPLDRTVGNSASSPASNQS
ncbi:hypothetical protein SCHPADRAFT_907816 [Schizopora paradoxa]|uniref:Uncharacterized protein n=1 Tax=Schizopora paradoxa TaxID=27342 RepID=A0A0H2RCX0_9AGAM|nr:hypothetical protein SCHPADRAFT_907816 [Schizopora paradoxa]